MRPSFFKETELLARATKGKRVLFLSHVRPDWDTLSSAFALSHFFSATSTPTFGVCEKPDPNKIPFFAHFSPKVNVVERLADFDVVVCVDFRAPAQAGPLESQLRSFPGPILLLDHHEPSTHDFPKPVLSLLRPSAVATAQMVAEIGLELDADFPKPIARALAVGLLTDSARFLMANSETFRVMDFLFRASGNTYEELLALANPPLSASTRVSVMKSIRAVQLDEVGNYLLAMAYHPYHGSLTASALVQLGVDVGIGLFRSKEGIFASIRVSSRAHRELKFDAMKLILPFAKEHDGTAGGHAQAAQLNLPAYFAEDVLHDFFKRALVEKVRAKDKKAMIKKR